MVPFAGLLAALDQIPDPRRRQGRRYPLPHLLLFSVLAVLAGATSYRGLRVFMAVHRERLNAVFGTSLRRAPAVNTVRALFQALEAGASGFLLKNASPERLIDAVRTVAAGDALLAPDVTRRVISRATATVRTNSISSIKRSPAYMSPSTVPATGTSALTGTLSG